MTASPNAPSGPPIPPGAPGVTSRGVWILVFSLAGLYIGTITGALAYAGGASIPAAVLTGGGAVGGCIALLIAVARYITGSS
jgi:hypothetical protein